MFESILGNGKRENSKILPFFVDFNLTDLLSRAASLVKKNEVCDLYYEMPGSREEVLYRRNVSGDMMKGTIREAFWKYATQIAKAEEYESNARFSNVEFQAEKYHMDALYLFHTSMEELKKTLQKNEISQELSELLEYIVEYENSAQCRQWMNIVTEIHEALDANVQFFSISEDRVLLRKKDDNQDLADRFYSAFGLEKPEEKVAYRRDGEVLTAFEARLAKKMIVNEKLEKKLRLLQKYEMDETLLQVAREVWLYLSFFKVKEQMERAGYTFCLPEEGDVLEIENGIDLGMALHEKHVVGNSIQMREGERFLVITGANGGGKTTFARMVGQIVYLAMMGLPIPAKSGKIPYYSTIFSHFSKEESLETGKGKLKEELDRLAPMMQGQERRAFIVLNELFTTAASYDAEIMGHRVMDHFIGLDCTGIYVTHIQALARGREEVVSLVAELDPVSKTRTFEIVRKPAEEGEYENSIIAKYDMVYQQMKGVMKS